MVVSEGQKVAKPISVYNSSRLIVAKDGTGTVKTIAEAIVPEKSNSRTIIYVKAERYEENNLKVGRKKMNVMFIGDGKGRQ
ncbi:hypothetical protein HAX54_049733 [Datura stramonium]|uniref:Pectinesterase catalytic domain-containing protein n=1 Tax=Datura stramonium TaxID=4076 RepID=A0ABS8WPI6_DATST|nr:hypothetical protein [Datura stramonium]